MFTQKVKIFYCNMTYTKGIFFNYFTQNQKKTFWVLIVRNIFLLIVTVIITEI